jgi:hypothetical protein
MSGQLHAPIALPLWKEPQYPMDRRLGGPQSLSGGHGEEKIVDPTGTQTPTSSVVQPVSQSLYRLRLDLVNIKIKK